VDHVSNIIIGELATMAGAVKSKLIFSKRKAINTLFPYAIFLEQGGQQGMINAILRAARISDSKFSNIGKFMWSHVVLYISRLFENRSPTSLNRVIALVSPYVPWQDALNNPIAVSRWAAAALAIPYTDEVGENVVDALFQIASVDSLRPHIPIEIWGWLKRRPPLSPIYHGLQLAGHANAVAYVRRLGDMDVLVSYFYLAWTDQFTLLPKNFKEMESSLREDFGEIGMEDRKDLIERLDHVIEGLERRRKSAFVLETRARYSMLRNVLLEVDWR
jgi:hypothetical protein